MEIPTNSWQMETVSSHLDVIDKETKQFLENKTMPKTLRW